MTDSDRIDNLRPALIAVSFIVVAALVAAWIVRGLGPRDDFATDHGLDASSPGWVQCLAETIERNPSPFTAGGFEIEQIDEITVRVRGTLRTTSVSRGEGNQFTFRGPFGSQERSFDCPSTGS